jgi:sugar phosphate isomerase/epimerase
MQSRRHALNRREFVQTGAALAALTAVRAATEARAQSDKARGRPTQFQIACMTLPYSAFPFERALTGLQKSGYQFVALGTTHNQGNGKRTPILAPDAGAAQARDVAKLCRARGLEPVLMFSGVYPDAPHHLEIMKSRILQAEAAGIGQLLTFGNPDPKKSNKAHWVQQFRALGPIARDHGVLIVIKQHGGLTANGAMTLEILREIDHENVKLNYDAGNVMDYLHVDPGAIATDIEKCAAQLHSFCIKDHRRFPKDEDSGPGLGEIDHYRLLAPVAFAGRALPLCCENIFAPVVPRPAKAEGIDELARRAREFLEIVVKGVQA